MATGLCYNHGFYLFINKVMYLYFVIYIVVQFHYSKHLIFLLSFLCSFLLNIEIQIAFFSYCGN